MDIRICQRDKKLTKEQTTEQGHKRVFNTARKTLNYHDILQKWSYKNMQDISFLTVHWEFKKKCIYIIICILNIVILQLTECCVTVLVTAFKETILKECAQMIKSNETESKYYLN